MRVLNVAEKPAMSKSIANILSGGSFKREQGLNKYCANYVFHYTIDNKDCIMVMTSVLGHIMCIEFPVAYNNWNTIDPYQLFDAQIERGIVKPDNEFVVKNIEKQAKHSDMLIIWTDCDREGEAIGSNIALVCRKTNPKILVKRARFSSVTKQELNRSMCDLYDIDGKQALAVDIRQELDLRTGSAFTRFLTLRYRKTKGGGKDGLISYGSCQFPTLGFIVERYLEHVDFIKEKFWDIKMEVIKEDIPVNFTWERNKLFDPLITSIIYESILKNPVLRIESVERKPVNKRKPYPLTTVDLQKALSSYLKMSSHMIMKHAESLYNKGFMSYPRTETNQFPRNFDYKTLIRQQEHNSKWGKFAEDLSTKFKLPRQGNLNDSAHPPIHPTKAGDGLSGPEAKVYEFVTRRFLACCSDDSRGFETKVSGLFQVDLGDGYERFLCNGLEIKERNYLDVYIYDKWCERLVPSFDIGEKVCINSLMMDGGITTPPKLLTEADLISTMDKNGIGTDATIHDHIHTVQARGYANMRSDRRFEPSGLGIALIVGFDKVNSDPYLSKPLLRKRLELDMKMICESKCDASMVLEENIILFKKAYSNMVNNVAAIDMEFSRIQTIKDDRDETDTDIPLCRCQHPAVMRSVQKSGKNKKRMFYTCNSVGKCSFFKWVDTNEGSS